MAKTKIHGEYLDTSVISGQTQVTAVGADSMLIFDATDNALKKALLSDLIETVGSTPSFTSATISGDLTVDTSTLKVDSSNNRVGILTSSPANLLHIEGSAATVSATQLTLESRFTGYGAGIDFVSRTSNGGTRVSMAKITADGENSFSTTTSTQDAGLRFFTTNSGTQAERMRIDTAGTLYLGTTSPTLHSATGGIVFTNGSLLTDIPRAASRSINLAQNAAVDSGNTWAYLVTDEASLFQQFGGNHYFKTAASGSAGADITFDTKMFIANAGNVGIGTNSPSQKLHVVGEIKATSADITDSAGNTSIGYGALNNLTSGDSNVAVGYEALEDVTDAIHNVGLGYRAGMNITTGDYNVAVGNYALSTNTTGGWNTCIGYGAGNTMSGNDHNTCIGRNAGYNITSGGSNTIIGSQAGDAQTSAHNNTFVGTRAGTSATTGNGYNTAIGVDALEDCTTGSFNVSLGTNTIKNVTTGHNNIGVGYRAGNAGQPGGQITSQSNIACIGDTAITSLNCQVSLSVASDERDKTDFTALDLGLDFVKSLQPYTFRWDKRSSYVDWDKNPDTDLLTVTHDGTHKEAQLDIGFKAQDVEKLEKSAGYNRTSKTNLTYALSPDGKTYSMKYEKLVPVLVKAIQELEAKVAELESK